MRFLQAFGRRLGRRPVDVFVEVVEVTVCDAPHHGAELDRPIHTFPLLGYLGVHEAVNRPRYTRLQVTGKDEGTQG